MSLWKSSIRKCSIPHNTPRGHKYRSAGKWSVTESTLWRNGLRETCKLTKKLQQCWKKPFAFYSQIICVCESMKHKINRILYRSVFCLLDFSRHFNDYYEGRCQTTDSIRRTISYPHRQKHGIIKGYGLNSRASKW